MRTLNRLHLTEAQWYALDVGSSFHYLGYRQNWAHPTAMRGLARKGLADIRVEHGQLTYCLTSDGTFVRDGRCTCPPGLVAGGGFRSNCPARGVAGS